MHVCVYAWTKPIHPTVNILDNAVKLHDVLRAHGKNEGRVNITFGLYKGVPVAVAETQMG